MDQLGTIIDGGKLRIDAQRLIDTRALIQGSSGSGKSWLIRLLIEKLAAKIPVIVLDLEGEFVTLREKFDFVVAGEGGEVAVDVRSAALLARKLLELKLSGVISLYELDRPHRRAYVRYFLESIMNAPRNLWAPRLIVLDEAHEFAPEGSPSESKASVIDVASRGRKRGFCLVGATQRMSKLDKDIVAELRNVFVGQTTLDVDVKRSLDTLGFPADLEHKRELRSLDHQFYAMGPATSAEGVVLFKADDVKTTHPESGLRRSLSPPEPSKRIKQALGELADLPKQAADEANDMASAKKQIADLKRQVAAKPAPAADPKAVERAVASAVVERDRHWKGEVAKVEKAHSAIVKRVCTIRSAAEGLLKLSTLNGDATISVEQPKIIGITTPKIPARQLSYAAPKTSARTIRQDQPTDCGEFKFGKAEQSILRAFYWTRDGESTPAKIGFYSGYSHKSGSFANTISRLRSAGLVESWSITDAGVAMAAEYAEAKPSGLELREWLRPKISKCENEILDTLMEAGGNRLSPEQIAAATPSQYSHGSGSFANALARLRSLEAAEGYGGQGVKAADVFFE